MTDRGDALALGMKVAHQLQHDRIAPQFVRHKTRRARFNVKVLGARRLSAWHRTAADNCACPSNAYGRFLAGHHELRAGFD